MRRNVAIAAGLGFIVTVFLANWAIETYGPIKVWPTELIAPAGVYFAGVAFLLRDTVQRLTNSWLALACVLVGTALTALISAKLALASASGFGASEFAALAVFAGLQRQSLSGAIASSQVVGAAVDSYVFLTLAFGSTALFAGQFVAKLSVIVLALPAVLLSRRLIPAPVQGRT